MKTLFYSTKPFEKTNFEQRYPGLDISFVNAKLNEETAELAKGCQAVCLFTSDRADAPVLDLLHAEGVKYIVLRSAGYDHVDVPHARQAGIRIAHVPAYSPYSVAEHSIALMLALNRKLIKAHEQFQQNDFRLDNLIGFDMNGKTAGIIGVGKIGAVAARILHGFGCRVLAYDLLKSALDFVEYTDLDTLLAASDIISLYVPATPETKHLVNKKTISQMKKGVMLVNTSRGVLVNTPDLLEGLKNGQIGAAGLDVYEFEKKLYFEDHSHEPLADALLSSLKALDNVLLTGHQAFLTRNALDNITDTTLQNLKNFETDSKCENEL